MSRLGLTREQLAAVGALLVVLLGCVLAAGYSLSLRGDAADELAERRELLARLARAPAGAGGTSGPARIVEAPAAAFIDAPTHGQAGAQLQSYFARLATEQNATVAMSGVEAATREAPDDVLVQATLEISLDALQALLYQLETGTPYLTVGSLSVRPASPAAQRSTPDGPLRVSLTLRGQWRRAGA
ncbi:MAG: type II secretion system protein GspM [Microvirga sp.]